MINYLKGNVLIKLHNCFFCHFNKTNFKFNIYPKIKNQYLDYLIWSIKQYQINFFYYEFIRKNFLMKSQVQNLSIFDIKNIAYHLQYKL